MKELNEQELAKLHKEKFLGDEHQRTWDAYIQPFFDGKEKQLFEAFKDTSITNSKHLNIIHMQLGTLRSIEDHFRHFIQTGKMAAITLDEQEGK